MSEEERKILELLNMTNVTMGCILDDKQANIILNYINRLQKDLTTIYMKGFYDGENKWQNKISQKIIELKESRKKLKLIYGNNEDTYIHDYKIKILEDILKE